jgi:nitric oxide reductase subunit B
MLFCLTVNRSWRTEPLAFAFWSINIGLALLVLLSDLPRGLMQTVASVNVGMWWSVPQTSCKPASWKPSAGCG